MYLPIVSSVGGSLYIIFLLECKQLALMLVIGSRSGLLNCGLDDGRLILKVLLVVNGFIELKAIQRNIAWDNNVIKNYCLDIFNFNVILWFMSCKVCENWNNKKRFKTFTLFACPVFNCFGVVKQTLFRRRTDTTVSARRTAKCASRQNKLFWKHRFGSERARRRGWPLLARSLSPKEKYEKKESES